MKRIVCILTSIIISVSVFCSCSGYRHSPELLAKSINERLDIGGVLYSSVASLGEEGYLSGDLTSQMFLSPIPEGTEVALVILPSVKVTHEVGVFYSRDSFDRLLILEIVTERLSLLKSYDAECESAIISRGGYVFYAFSPYASRLNSVVDGIF